MAKNHKSTGSKNIHILRNCLEWSSLKYYSLQPLLDLNIGCVTSFWSQEHKFKLSRSIWSCLENCEEFHLANQIIHGFKIDSKGADKDSVHIKGSSDAFDRMNHCCKKNNLMWEPAFPSPQMELICSLENALVLSSSVMEAWMLKEGSARRHDCQIWRILCPLVSTPLLYMLIPWTFELVSLIFQYLLFFFYKHLFIMFIYL